MPGIYYLDLQDLTPERWQAALPSLVHARAVIVDMRGYPDNAAFTMIGHFTAKPVRSPSWQVPMLESSRYRTTSWNINPLQPRIEAKLIVLLDGRAASAAETFLQIIHDNHLAILVGENSGGTNGSPNTLELPCEFTLRFTGMRVPFTDGSALQGHGITPDMVVHPTLAGVRAGRDEVLETAVGIASRLIVK
jgi:C-terminal processing protease CtpA/Prc